MAKAKQRASASQRREEVRKQRQQRLSNNQSSQAQIRNQERRRRQSKRGLPWGLVVGALLVIVAIVGILSTCRSSHQVLAVQKDRRRPVLLCYMKYRMLAQVYWPRLEPVGNKRSWYLSREGRLLF